MRLGCIVMASGAGKRFREAGGKGQKLLVPCPGPRGAEPLVVRTAASVPEDRYEVAVVTWLPQVARAVERSGLPAAIVRHDAVGQPPRGDTVRMGAVHAAARGWDGVLYLPGDQPFVSRASFCALADAFEAGPDRAYRLGWRGEPASPVLFPARCVHALMRIDGEDGGASVLRASGVETVLVEAERAEELVDIDVPADLGRVAWS